MLLFKSRYSVLVGFATILLIFSFLIRTTLLIWCFPHAALTFGGILSLYLKGLVFDLGVVIFFTILYAVYLLLLPQRWNNSRFNRIFTYTGFFLSTFILMFSFFAELTFWGEFESRFNFIAVDYLVYTYEVVNNINQSYPLPLLVGGMLLTTTLLTIFLHRKKVFRNSFHAETSFKSRLAVTGLFVLLFIGYVKFIPNSWAEQGTQNRYQQELSKAGVYSFFAAFMNNELPYDKFYLQEDDKTAWQIIRNYLASPNSRYLENDNSIYRYIQEDTSGTYRPNVIMVTIESFSASFMERFGNQQHITPVLDALAKESVLFTKMFATGTRTVRGMEALTLAVPPTPGNSIVRRTDNAGLFSVGTIFKQAGYDRTFFYGGDGYFDNMNQFFGSNSFDITDRGRRLLVGDNFTAKRTFIPDSLVRFENAWGICDEDIYAAAIRQADEKFAAGKPFFDFVMTTSNHRPFTYPSGKIDIPPGSREGAVKYTDYAIGEFLKQCRQKPWFKNTVFIFVADHCASSAGKNEIEVSKYHIPCMVYNIPNMPPREISILCSQIDLYPTLLSMLGWSYNSNLYGKNVLLPDYKPRAFVGTYQKLGYLDTAKLVILSPQRQAETYRWDLAKGEQSPVPADPQRIKEAVAWYQTAYEYYKNGGMKERK